jgi:hypothetical protein
MHLKITPQHLIVALAGWAFALSAAAQYQWVGKDGRKVFSDRPPPADILEKDILKQPGARPASVAVAPADASDTAAKPKVDANAPKISGKDAELRKRPRKRPRKKKSPRPRPTTASAPKRPLPPSARACA